MKSRRRFLCIVLTVLLLAFTYLIMVLNSDMYRVSRLGSDDLMQIKLLDTPNKWMLASETQDTESEVQNPRGM
jgi:hypothetical protein